MAVHLPISTGQLQARPMTSRLPVGKHPLQLYSLATPNGVKVTVMLEELLAQNITGAEYDAWLIQIRDGDQFGSGFVEINPNSKIPALMDHSVSPPLRVFESGNILLYLADKFATLIPKTLPAEPNVYHGFSGRWEARLTLVAALAISMPMRQKNCPIRLTALRWKPNASLMFLIASLPNIAMSVVTNTALPILRFGLGMGNWFLAVFIMRLNFWMLQTYSHVMRWAKAIDSRPAVKRGRMVNRVSGAPEFQLHERHDASDFDNKTQDKIA
jgi:GST-like protein